MATQDPIRLTEGQLRLLGEWSARTGKSAEELLAEALHQFAPAGFANGRQAGTLFDRLTKSGLLGSLSGGPTDLSTNPHHMEGFGE